MNGPTQKDRRFFNKAEKRALFFASGGVCETPGCGNLLDASFHADHVKPYSKGGETSMSNAEALCPQCNLKKGAKETLPIILRKWQSECLASVNRKAFSQGLKDFLANVTPGAGKTILALSLAGEWIKGGEYDFVIVVVPSENLKRQWHKEAWECMNLSLEHDMENCVLKDARMRSRDLPDHINGYCTTYQSVSKDAISHDAVCRRKNVLVILDEIHHAGEDNEWGKGLSEAFKNAKFRLMLSGTPFRSGNSPIQFVNYDGHGVCVPDFNYGYAQALRDDICRPVIFPQFDGKMEWINGSETFEATFDDELDEKGRSERLRTALKADGNFMRNMVGRAYERLVDIRTSGEHPGAAGLIVCMDTRHANEVAATMRRDYKIDPVVVHCDDKDAHSNIEKFKNSDAPWIIAISMVSEGVDIKRIRVIVYATNTVTELFFLQVMGREIRVIDGLEEQTAYMYIPGDKRLVAMARSIQTEINHVLLSDDRPPHKKEKEGDPSERTPSGFIAMESDGDEVGHIYGNDIYGSEEIEFVRQMQGANPSLKRTPEAPLAALIRGWGKLKGLTDEVVAVAPLRVPGDNPLIEVGKLKKEQNALARQIAFRLFTDPKKDEFRWVHGEAKRAAGIAKLELASLDQLRAKSAYLKKWWGDISST